MSLGGDECRRTQHRQGAGREHRPCIQYADEIDVSRSDVRKRRLKLPLWIVLKSEITLVYDILNSVS